MSGSNNEGKKKERRFSQEQYDMLLCCSKAGDITEWNEWRKEHPDEEIWLERRDFSGWYLKGVFLNSGVFVDRQGGTHNFTGSVYLRGSKFRTRTVL